MVRVFFTDKYLSQFEELPESLQNIAYKKIDLFKNNPRHSSLKTHKLNGRLKDCLAFSVDHKFRIVFEYAGKNAVNFLKIGDHDVYR